MENIIKEIIENLIIISGDDNNKEFTWKEKERLNNQNNLYIFPSNQNLSIQLMTDHIAKFISTWNLSCAWKYCVDTIPISASEAYQDNFHCFEVKFSKPTNECPISLQTASIFFRIEINQNLPGTDQCRVSYQFEGGFHSFYDVQLNQKFQEYHLERIVELKKIFMEKNK